MTDVAKLEYLQTVSNVSTLANVIVTAVLVLVLRG